MAEELGQSRTEAPTQCRREEALSQGQVAISAEFSTGMLLLASAVTLWLVAQTLSNGLLETLRFNILSIRKVEFTPEAAQALFINLFARGGQMLGLFLGMLLVVGLAVSVLQVGFHLSPNRLLPNWEKLSPATGWGRILSAAGAMRGVMFLVKVAVAASLAYWVIKGRATQIAILSSCSLSATVAQAWGVAVRMALAISAALLVLGLADYVFQRWRHETSLMMTRQEMKEEVKREEGDPQIRARIRKLQREAARKRMYKDVPRATVVITNPTHLAIALRYERGVTTAPKVVAKGAGFVAQRIVTLARGHAVPVVERKPVARALYKAVKVGQEIPIALYVAVAEVLAYVYRLRGTPDR